MNYCYICSNKKCDLLVPLQRHFERTKKLYQGYTKGIRLVGRLKPIGRRGAAIGYR